MGNPESGGDFIRKCIEGNDVVTMLGIAAFETPEGVVPYASAIVLYSECPDPKERETNYKFMEQAWGENYFEKGFEIVRRGPLEAYLSSKRRAFMAAVDTEVNAIEAPSYTVTLVGEADAIDKFFQQAETSKYWVFHQHTIKASFVYIVDFQTGRIISKFRKEPPIEIVKAYENGGKP